MEEITTGVNETAVAEQETTAQTTTETTETTGVKTEQVAAEPDKVEKAFAARLAKEREKIETEVSQKAIDKYIASQGYEWNGKPITTEAEYKQALYEKELQDKGQDPNEVKKLIDEHPDVKAAREYRENQEKEARQKAEYLEFFNEFPDAKPETIPTEVWEENAKGKPLADAYARYLLKQQRAEADKAKANETNAKSSMGSVGTNGNTDPSFISAEEFEKNRGNQDWVNKNFDKINKSRAKW